MVFMSKDVVVSVLLPLLTPIDAISLIQSDVFTSAPSTDEYIAMWSHLHTPTRKTSVGRVNQFIQTCKVICVNCYKRRGRSCQCIHGRIHLCDQCKKLPEFKLICKSTAIQRYKVKPSILKTLKCIHVKNPHYSCAPEMVLYRESDIMQYARAKYY